MIDIGQEETDALLEQFEKRVERIYRRAVKETKESLNEYLAEFRKQDKEFRLLVQSGKMTEEAYTAWRKTEMLRGKRFREMLNTLADDFVNSDKIAMSMLNGYLPEAYAINRNFAAFQVEKGALVDTSFTLYDRQTVERLVRDNPQLLPKPRVDIPKDRRWNRRKIKEEITQAVLQGDPIEKIATRLQKVANMNYAAAVRNARTAMTAAQNSGRIDSYKYAQELGIDMMQEWMATNDSRTRHSHAMMDGERINVGGVFSNGCRYPGDPNGPAEETYNCRCTIVAFLTGFNFSDARHDARVARMGYDDWKEARRK